ncbi:MAG: aminoacyl-tRNA hydrolase, partial [Gammaproteobacteria bacterium]|nr:aminoacyl-tRNA hydrolase [Gammaproteobacteria bacterium]
GVAVVQKSRTATRPTKASRKRRLDSKTRRGRTKELRGKVSD